VSAHILFYLIGCGMQLTYTLINRYIRSSTSLKWWCPWFTLLGVQCLLRCFGSTYWRWENWLPLPRSESCIVSTISYIPIFSALSLFWGFVSDNVIIYGDSRN